MEKEYIVVAAVTVIAVAAMIFSWRKGGDADSHGMEEEENADADGNEEEENADSHENAEEENADSHRNEKDGAGTGNVELFRGKKQKRAFLSGLEQLLKRLTRPKHQSPEEKKATESLQTLKELAELGADSEEIFKALSVFLEDGFQLGILYRKDIQQLKKDLANMKREMNEKVARFQRELKGVKRELNRVKQGITEDVDRKLTEGRTKMENERTKMENERTKMENERTKMQNDLDLKLGFFQLESRYRERFVDCGEWNSTFHRLVAWLLNTNWVDMSTKLKAEGNDWEHGDMHREVKNLLQRFRLTMDPQDLWNWSVHLQDGRNRLCHDDTIRNLRGSELKTAIESELLKLNTRLAGRGDPGKAVPDFDNKFDGVMVDILGVMKSNIPHIDAMKSSQWNQAQAHVHV